MKNSPSSKQAKSNTVSHTPKKDLKQKKPYTKSNSREKDQTSSTDCHNATKTTFFFHSRKGNNSNSHNYSETTINSQVLRDSESKEREHKNIGVTPPRQIAKRSEKGHSGSPLGISHAANKQKIKAIDWEKVLNSKEKEIKNLEDVTVTMNKEIDKAIGFIERNKILPNVLHEKEKEVEVLNNQLAHVMNEIHEMRLYSKARSIPNIYESHKEYLKRDKLEDITTIGERILNRDPREKVKSRENFNNFENKVKVGRSEKREGSSNRDKTKLKGSTGSTRSREQNSNILAGQNDVIVHISTTENIDSINRTLQVGDSDHQDHEKEDLNKYNETKETKGHCLKKGHKSYREKGDQSFKKDALKNLLSKLKRSLSPDKQICSANNEKYKMYTEDPIKKMVPHYLKSKHLRTGNKEILMDSIKTHGGKKIVKTSTHIDGVIAGSNVHVDEEKIKTIKKTNRKQGTSSLSPKREVLLTQKLKIMKEGLGVNEARKLSKVLTPKSNPKNPSEGSKSIRREEKASDVVQRIDTMLQGFCRIAEKYKKLSEVLQKKNQRLEKRVRDLSENKIKPT